ncbi:MAG: enoyl-CoA hydratase-related protein [Dehalococcoidia bacterium]
MDFETIRYERDGHVTTITLNRPERLNAFNERMSFELSRAWSEVRDDPGVRVAILTGAGDRAFCSGVDIAATPDGDPLVTRPWIARMTAKGNECYKPVIVAVNGLAAGGAAYWIGECELAIAADHATFFDPHVDRGMVPLEEPMIYARHLPLMPVMRMILLGLSDRMDARTALAAGLVTEVVPAEGLMAAARRYAEIIASKSPQGVQRATRVLWQTKHLPLDEALEVAWREIVEHSAVSTDLIEGKRAFLEKRAPDWDRPAARG